MKFGQYRLLLSVGVFGVIMVLLGHNDRIMLCSASASLNALETQSMDTSAPSFAWEGNTQGAFVTSIAHDRSGWIAVGTEDQGVWLYDPEPRAGNPTWSHYTAESTAGGLGDDECYALAFDRLGRLWAGTNCHGVSVFNGQKWQTYNITNGPLGLHVTAITVSPLNGDIWMATERGLSRYSESSHWSYFNRANGLSSDDIRAIAIDSTGTIYVATACDGLDIGHGYDNYAEWTTVLGPDEAPAEPSGAGIPSNMLTSLLVTGTDEVVVGTNSGIAVSNDSGSTWKYVRGADWQARATGYTIRPVEQAMVSAIELIPTTLTASSSTGPPVAIACGNSTIEPEFQDRYFSGGDVMHSTVPVDVSGATDNAPPELYQNARVGQDFTYSIGGLTANASYRMRLHFAEPTFNHVGQRTFDVTVNGQPLLQHFDVFEVAGDRSHKAVIEETNVHADMAGIVSIRFEGNKVQTPSVDPNTLLSADYVTSLGQSSDGDIWVGHRQTGVDVLDQTSFRRILQSNLLSNADYATCLLAVGGGMVAGRYGGGVNMSSPVTNEGSVNPPADLLPIPFPQPANAPNLSDLNDMLKALSEAPTVEEATQPFAIAADDDWLTEGDWIGRYGKFWACLCADSSPYDILWGAGWQQIYYNLFIGPNADAGDSLRYYVEWLYSKDRKVLELPPVYLDSRIQKGLTTPDMDRRDAEVDDHGEVYPMEDGPNVYCTLTIPKGLYYLSLYEYNKDGHGDDQRYRDYRLSVREHQADQQLNDIGSFADTPEWAHERVEQFWNGVWKRFLVHGPTELTIEDNRNNSLNTTLPAVMLDLADEDPPPYFESKDAWEAAEAAAEAKLALEIKSAGASSSQTQIFNPAITADEAVTRILNRLADLQTRNPRWWIVNKDRFYTQVLRWYLAQPGPIAAQKEGMARCYYELSMFSEWEICESSESNPTIRSIEKSLKWDGPNDRRTDYDVVTEYLKGRNPD